MTSPPGGVFEQYLSRYAERELPDQGVCEPRWHDVVVLPAYRESPDLLDTLRHLPTGSGRTLVVLVLNRPDSDEDTGANGDLRQAVKRELQGDSPPLLALHGSADLYLLDLERLRGATPASEGVGLARKAGCDLALQWMASGAISGEWICSTDADATLPGDYFTRLASLENDAAAAVFPFHHIRGVSHTETATTALYELRLHHHVLGLQYAGSPYAYHTLGSCLAVRASAYARVRGFPRRSGGEDFYLLNKIAKLGPVTRLKGAGIQLQSRFSSRVPFGTGPAVQALASESRLESAPIFYHPQCYEVLRALMDCLPELAARPEEDNLTALLVNCGLQEDEAREAENLLMGMGFEDALRHCRRQSKTSAQYLRHFHQWFDAFLSLKLIHGLRDARWPMQSLQELHGLTPRLWPADEGTGSDTEALRKACTQHWDWE